MVRNITIFFVTAIFILFFLPVCFSQSNTNTPGSADANVSDKNINKDESVAAASQEAPSEGTEVKKEEKTEEEKKAEKKKAEEKKAEEEKKKEKAEEEEPPAPEENLDSWGEYAPTERESQSDEPTHDVWNDDQGFIDR
ncbi:MAG: hypothetical protein WC546_06785 [Candidatus Omnitrophota bacterium]